MELYLTNYRNRVASKKRKWKLTHKNALCEWSSEIHFKTRSYPTQ
uniref:Uncharacterized protein n=1 Tax=Utricularia reniformis TaxID=192314 RepID=A0A1Y0B4X7_9LAMI|nr:hypothetical protein AEK19_MT2284 [Utricularia reniformis]ART32429.1 hypothetical protein AEK19_MT2284 [Utricularia reniformis]